MLRGHFLKTTAVPFVAPTVFGTRPIARYFPTRLREAGGRRLVFQNRSFDDMSENRYEFLGKART
jgi:hypothetical protein